MINNKKLTLMLIFVLLFSLAFVAAAEIEMTINAKLGTADTDFYLLTDSSAESGYEAQDFAIRSFPSGDYSFLYSVVGSDNLIIDTFSSSGIPRTINLVYEIDPAEAGTLTLVWNNDFDSSFTITLKDYGTDNTRTTLVPSGSTNMKTSSSYSVAHSADTKRYFQVVIENTPATPVTPSTSPSQGGGPTSTPTTPVVDETEEIVVDCTNKNCDSSGVCGTCGDGFSCISWNCVEDLFECKSNLDCGGDKTCNNGNCICNSDLCKLIDQKPKLEEIPQDLPVIGEAGCTNNFICGDWSECAVNYEVSNIFNGNDLTGTRTRLCQDIAQCNANFIDKKECSLKENVVVSNQKWCGEQYTEISNPEGKLLARLKSGINGEFVKVDINTEGESFCATCYDNIQDGDEQEIDCGGSCISCEKKKSMETSNSYLWFWEYKLIWIILLVSIFIILFVIWIILVIKLIKHIVEHIQHYRAKHGVLIHMKNYAKPVDDKKSLIHQQIRQQQEAHKEPHRIHHKHHPEDVRIRQSIHHETRHEHHKNIHQQNKTHKELHKHLEYQKHKNKHNKS